MPQKTNLKASPYFDDYNSDKDFYKVLFRPSYPIQGRELNTIQSILQNQIENYGRNQFKQGDLVVPGEVGLNKKLDFVKLSYVSEVAVNVDGEIAYQKYDINGLINQKVLGLSSGVTAIVLSVAESGENNSDTLYVKYLTAGSSGNEETFRQGENLEVIGGINSPLLTVGSDGSVLPTSIPVVNPDNGEVSFIDSGAMGYASAVKVESGVYFVNGFFVNNKEDLIIVDGYSDKPSVKVGFTVIESKVTPEEDSSLYDNAAGYSNFAAPGAHRLKIELVLTKYGYTDNPDTNFIQLISVKDGVIQKQIKPSTYTTIENTLARRTYDESGDYVVDNFDIDVREYYNKEGNLGIYPLLPDGTIGPQTLAEDRYSPSEAASKLAVTISPGKAYVRGYEIINKESKIYEIDKARETLSRDNVSIKSKGLASFTITNLHNTIPLNAEGADLTAYPTLYLNSVFNDGTTASNNLEDVTNYKQTIERRGLTFGKDDAIKTIYMFASFDLGLIDDSSLATNTPSDKADLKTLYFVQSRTNTGGVSTVKSVKTLSFAKVTRPEVGDVNAQYLQLTVMGRKDYLDDLFLEYDDNVSTKRRFLFLSLSNAQQEISPLGFIVDYDQSITPLIGVAKPKDFSLVERPVGFNQDTDIVLSKGRLSNGTAVYNGKFSLSYFNPIFLTRILVDSPITSDFRPGKYILGATSGAYGVIEGDTNGFLSSGKSLYVKTLYGNFVSGETIVNEEGQILRIARENTISHFVVSRQGTGMLSSAKVSINGVQYEQTDIAVGVNGGTLYKVVVNNRDAINTEYNNPPSVSFSGGATIQPIVLPVLFRNTVQTFSAQNVKSVWSSYGSGNIFTADVETVETKYSETLTVTEFTFSGTKGYKYIECNGFGSDASKVLVPGDVIQFNDSTGRINKFIVDYATSPQGTSRSRIYFNGALPDSVTGSSVVRLRPIVNGTATSTLVFPTGSKEVGSLIKSTEDTKIKYYIRRDFVTRGSAAGGNITFSAQLDFGTQRFVEYNESDFLITVLDKGGSSKVSKGDVVYISPDFINISNTTDETSGLSSGSITLSFPSNYFGDNVSNFPVLKLTATIEVSKGRPKLKTSVKNKRIIVKASGDRVIPFRGIDYDSENTESYTYSDAYALKYVYEGSASAPPVVNANGELVTGTDITNKYTFDDGQRDTFYDVSRISLKPGFDPPTGQIVIAFDYFEHSQGDFCTVDSYIHEAGVLPDEIPNFNSSVNGIVSLKNVIDFRPKVDSNAIITGFQDTSLLSQSEYISFTGPGGAVSSTPSSSRRLPYTVSFTESQYLDRIDGIFLTQKGEFVIKSGNASLNPSKPEMVDDAIPLSYLFIPAFTKTSKDVRITPVDNKRYTMRDIGKLEKRIERLEYYTTLSILEQQALNMQVKDSIGLERTKSGFVVDNFETHKVGNLKSIDYRCSIDSQQSVLRPQTKEDHFEIEEINTRPDQRKISGYKNSNNVITLDVVNEIPFASNQFATKVLNPNPFVVLQYVGDATLIPNIDQWYDTNTSPLVTDNNTGLFSIFLAQPDIKVAFASIYNSFIINWVGTNKTFFNINSLSETNSTVASSSVSAASVGSSSNVSPQNNEIAKGVGYKTVNGSSIANNLKFFARSVPVKFVLRGLKPKTQIFVFLDKTNVNRWVVPDSRFTGIPGNSLTTFNKGITTDEYGNASGIILIPSGKAPQMNTTWTGSIDTLQYDDTSADLYIVTGMKTIRFTSSAEDKDKNIVDSYAEVNYYATGLLPENPVSIISTAPATFKANEGVQIVDNNTDNEEKPNPLAQTFKVENFDGGMFATGVDLFFSKKSSTIPIRIYLSNVESDKPSKYIVPGSQVTLYPDTFLKVYSSGIIKVKVGEYVTGRRTGASGPLTKVLDKNNFEVVPSSNGEISLTNEQVYTFVLSNHNGTNFAPDEVIDLVSVTQFNNSNNATVALKIAKDSGKVVSLDVTSLGTNYESATITIESPQLPGGSGATGSVRVSGGKVYSAQVGIGGRGYTEAPSVVIKGSGLGNNGAVVQSKIDIDEPAVRMGVAIDRQGVPNSTTATRFNFEYPVYLQNNTYYALNIECDTTEYEIWASRLGGTDISTGLVVNTQPLLGSVFKSQNVDNWTEDLFEDIKFTLYRAEFSTRPAELLLKNKNLGFEKLSLDPFETYSLANSTATSTLFKNNSAIVKVNHRDHGFESSGDSKVFFQGVESFAGYDREDITNTLFTVANVGLDSYTIVGPNRAASNGFGGGKTVLASYNRKYEKLYAQIPYLQLTNTQIDSKVRTTNVIPVDSNTKNYVSYSMTEDYETTFLNEEQYFLNQKIICSRINEVVNLQSDEYSLMYKITLSTQANYLSPVIDLRSASVKTISNRVENPVGTEDRYGKRYQEIELYPVYKFTITGNNEGGGQPDVAITLNQNVSGLTSGAESEVLRVINNDIYVKIKNSLQFTVGEELYFSTQSDLGGNLEGLTVTISNVGIYEQLPSFDIGSTITAINPSTRSQKYENKISGKVISWDSKTKVLTLENDKQPINNNFTNEITLNSAYARAATTSNQVSDIFRVGDLIDYKGSSFETSKFAEIKSMSFSQGVDYVPETGSVNTSGLAKYVTKEIYINNPATSLNVYTTLNVKDIEDVRILYKIKPAASQQNFDDLNWEYFNGNGSPDGLNELASPENSISGQYEKQSSYQELRFTEENLPEFSSFAVKIVMKTSDPAYVPKIQDVRAVASY